MTSAPPLVCAHAKLQSSSSFAMVALMAVLSAICGAMVLLQTSEARACGNAVMMSDDAITKLRDAERALDEGDVLTARELATEVAHAGTPIPNEVRFFDRALRLRALSFVRDPSATPGDIDQAVTLLEQRVLMISVEPEPALAADFGEALERAHRDDEAIARLRPLADRDLIGSAYAYAALSRAAGRRGDMSLASTAGAKCRAIAAHPRMCSGEYPRPPLLRGTASGYALPGFAFLAAALVRLIRQRKQQAANAGLKSSATTPWSTFRAPFFTGIIAIAAVASFASARTAWLATAIALATVIIVPLWQRRAFLSHVRRGREPGFHVRAEEPAIDAQIPILRLFLGPKVVETLERHVDPSYRESARSPVLRLGRRPLRPVWIVTAVIVGLLFAGCASAVFLTSRGSASSVRVHNVFSPEE